MGIDGVQLEETDEPWDRHEPILGAKSGNGDCLEKSGGDGDNRQPPSRCSNSYCVGRDVFFRDTKNQNSEKSNSPSKKLTMSTGR